MCRLMFDSSCTPARRSLIRLVGRSFLQIGGAQVCNCDRPCLRRLVFPSCGRVNAGRGKPQQSARFRSRFIHRDEAMPSNGVKPLAAPKTVTSAQTNNHVAAGEPRNQ